MTGPIEQQYPGSDVTRLLGAALLLVTAAATTAAGQEAPGSYKVLATNKTSTMQKEMSDAARAGFRYVAVMGGETSFGGSEVVVIMGRVADGRPQFEYKLLATSKTSTMQKELQHASDAGFDYVGQTVFKSTFGGSEVTCIMERDRDDTGRPRYEYKLLATSRTSTLQKELQQVVEQGFEVVGLTVGETFGGGSELVTITRRRAR
jgi:hypothetical protein